MFLWYGNKKKARLFWMLLQIVAESGDEGSTTSIRAAPTCRLSLPMLYLSKLFS